MLLLLYWQRDFSRCGNLWRGMDPSERQHLSPPKGNEQKIGQVAKTNYLLTKEKANEWLHITAAAICMITTELKVQSVMMCASNATPLNSQPTNSWLFVARHSSPKGVAAAPFVLDWKPRCKRATNYINSYHTLSLRLSVLQTSRGGTGGTVTAYMINNGDSFIPPPGAAAAPPWLSFPREK